MNSNTKHLTIRGRVQGVSYRAWFHQIALQMGLSGWIRNRADGSVEAVIHGSPDALDRMITAAHVGPTMANVREIAARDTAYDGPATFEIRPTE